MDEKKVKVVLELSKECIQSSLYLMGEPLTDDLWEKLTSNEVVLSTDLFEDQKQQVELSFSCLAISKVSE